MGGDYNAPAFTKAAKVTFKEATSCVLLRDWCGQWQVMSCPHFWSLQSRRRWRVEVLVQHAGNPVPVAGQEKEAWQKQKAPVGRYLPTVP